MLLHAIVFALGLGILYIGADWLVQGASSVALRFGLKPLIVGLTIVALGTSMPEFLLNFFAIMMGEDALAIGNIVGSNISNIALILGLSAIVLPMTVSRDALRREYPLMLVVSFLFWGLAADGSISRLDGGILVGGLAFFMVYLIRDSMAHAKAMKDQPKVVIPAVPHEHEDASPAEKAVSRALTAIASRRFAPWARVILLVVGMAALGIGARLMVDSAVAIAELLRIHPVVIGLTIVAIGTSLPELAASMVCAIRKESDMSVGNILGSNMLNILFVVGVVSLIRPVDVEAEAIRIHFPVMIGFSLLLYPLARSGYTLSRAGGAVLLAGFLGYIGWLLYPYFW